MSSSCDWDWDWEGKWNPIPRAMGLWTTIRPPTFNHEGLVQVKKQSIQAILSHFGKKNLDEKWGGTLVLSPFSQILALLKFFTSVLTFLEGKKKTFSQKSLAANYHQGWGALSLQQCDVT